MILATIQEDAGYHGGVCQEYRIRKETLGFI